MITEIKNMFNMNLNCLVCSDPYSGIHSQFESKEFFSHLPRANKGTSHYINLIRYFIEEYCIVATRRSALLGFLYYFFTSLARATPGKGMGSRGRQGTAGEADPKKLCIFSPLFSHRLDETASDIDPACVGSSLTLSLGRHVCNI